MKLLWVNFKIKFNWIRRELCSRSPLPNWSGAALPPAPCGWCCFPHSFFGLVLRDDGSSPTGTVEKMGTVDNGHDGDGGEEQSSPSNGDDGDGHPTCFFKGCAVFTLSSCWVVLQFSQGGAALPSASRVALLLLPPSLLSPLRLFEQFSILF